MIRLLLLLIFFSLMSAPTKAAENLDFSTFSTLPILHEGRVKPIDSFGRILLKRFSGKEKLGDLSASEWVAQSIFDPAVAVETPVFKIFDAEKYGIQEQESKLYSYLELLNIIQDKEETIKTLLTEEKKLSLEQQALIKLYDNYILYTQLLRSLSFSIPLNIKNSDNKNFFDYQKTDNSIDKEVKQLVQKKGADTSRYNKEEKKLAALSYQLSIIKKASMNNVLFKIIPKNWETKDTDWLSPWAILSQENNNNKSLKYIENWQKRTLSYRDGDVTQWDNSNKDAADFFQNKKLLTEKIYNDLNLIFIAQILYILAFSILIFSAFFKFNKTDIIAFSISAIGLTLHAIHMGLRIYILDRPPVGTLYESILFVSFISVLGLLFLSYKQKTSTGTLLASLSGIILLITAQGFTSEDNMGQLVAVLNTNFWLSTHVLCISIGYGLCLITSLMAHYYLVQKIRTPENKSVLTALMKNLKTLTILSLLFTIIGTILGGIWADQSWGRFWGWDPKENGALLIVLWIVWLLHGRISQHVTETGFVVGSAFLSIIVVLAWFGVNLLNVGLHSYGFITGVAVGIGAFCLSETIIIGGLWLWGKRLS